MDIQELNKIYQKALENAEVVCNDFSVCNIKHKVGFYNNHEIKGENGFIKEIYPIPVISCIINNIKIDIGFDVISTTNYMGFLELTLRKTEILDFNFNKLKNFKFEIYGFKNFKDDYYWGNIEKTKLMIKNSKEIKFHIGIDFSSLQELKELLEIIKN